MRNREWLFSFAYYLHVFQGLFFNFLRLFFLSAGIIQLAGQCITPQKKQVEFEGLLFSKLQDYLGCPFVLSDDEAIFDPGVRLVNDGILWVIRQNLIVSLL